MDKFQDKYRISSTRASWWDYASSGVYFITICTQNRECYFRQVLEKEMILSEMGNTVNAEWLKTFDIRKDMNLTMGEYVVMPNHFHAIIVIGKNEYNQPINTDEVFRRDAVHRVSTTTPANAAANKFGPQSKNLASIIRGFKSAVTTHARKIHADFAWQSRFHDHIFATMKNTNVLLIISTPIRKIGRQINFSNRKNE
ncbi:MAG: hypothetical protein K0M50_03585 [Prolixibacteraceae bacterium]|nr:hypothetical protein [Prolixibacteraceae bacterium]